MEELNKNQIVLLVLLVSFVTSIATGIVTVTLMDQAPAAVTQTVNRIVERTVERVVPGETTERTVIREVPVMVTQEELILGVVQAAEPALVRITRSSGGAALASGFVVDTAGTVVTTAHTLPSGRLSERYDAVLRDGTSVEMRLMQYSPELDIAILRPDDASLFTTAVETMMAAVAQTSSTSDPRIVAWRPLELAVASEVVPGQTVVALGLSESSSVVSGGLISAITLAGERGNISHLKTAAVNTSNIGGPLLNTKGQVVGIGQEIGSALAASAISGYNTTN